MHKKKTLIYIVFILAAVLAVQAYSVLYFRFFTSPQFIMSSISQFSAKHLGSMLITVLLGTLFGIENLIRFKKLPGKWCVDFKRLLFIGLPLALLSIQYFDFLFANYVLAPVVSLPVGLLSAPARLPFYRLALGYVVLTSFYKTGKNDVIEANIDLGNQG